ncbi:WD REPEATS REGION domain-containing protein [Citrus sinensis]|nr:WD REPEATS REGION domain-containing protein [Citrus sinensis]
MNRADENLNCFDREMDSEANCMVDELEQDQMNECVVTLEGESNGFSQSVDKFENPFPECKGVNIKKVKKLWKRIISMKKRNVETCMSEKRKPNSEKPKANKMEVKQNKKKCMEFTALYTSQEIQAHKGCIWTLKFSPDGRYLASGGEDGVVRIWHVTSVAASCKSFTDDGGFGSNAKEGKIKFGKKKSSHVPVVIPDEVFQIEESPLQELHGHKGDVLDLAWSNSNYLLSCSMDKTVRMWQVGCNQCLNVFDHHNYVTCVQFNPIDDNYFISGSIDGKVRIWGVCEKRVVDWADVRDVISAICYIPDGKGFIVGSITGTCHFYKASGNDLKLEKVDFHDRKKTSGNKITGIQFSRDESQRIMITSEDSKLRILDGVDVIHKFKGLPKSGSQMSASFTTTGKHIISIGDDCHVYVWNYDELCFPSSKQKNSVRSCEHFFSEGVSVAVQWPGIGTEQKSLCSSSLRDCSQKWDNLETAPWIRDSERFSLGSWFSNDGPCRGSATWPAEKLPLWDVTIDSDGYCQDPQQQRLQQQCLNNVDDVRAISATWGLVIVTAGCDGMIKTFHNYGLPIRL